MRTFAQRTAGAQTARSATQTRTAQRAGGGTALSPAPLAARPGLLPHDFDRITIQRSTPAPTPAPAPTAPTTPTTPASCTPASPRGTATGCTPNPQGSGLPPVGGTHTESHPRLHPACSQKTRLRPARTGVSITSRRTAVKSVTGKSRRTRVTPAISIATPITAVTTATT